MLRRTAKDEIAFKFGEQMQDQFIAWVTSVEEQNASSRNVRQEQLGLLSFTGIHGDNGPGYGKTPENVVHGGDKSLRIVSFPWILESAFGVKLFANFLCCGKIIRGAVYAENRHAMPEIFRTIGPALIGYLDGLFQYFLKDLPRDFFARLTQRAALRWVGVKPKTASFGIAEKYAGFHVNTIGLSAGDQGKYEDDEPVKRKFSGSSEIFWGLFL